MSMQSKKSFAMVDYKKCRPDVCSPENGTCSAAAACSHKVIQKIDGKFEPPIIFQDRCLACWDCIAACPLDAVVVKQVS